MKTETQNTLPVNADLERSILACILLDSDGGCYLQAAQRISPEDFGLDSHRLIFSAMLAIAESGKPIDYLTLTQQLQATGELTNCGGVPYVTDLTDAGKFIRLRNISHYLDSLLESASRRSIISATDSAMRRAYDLDSPGDIAGELKEHLDRLTQRAQSQSCVSASEIAREVAKRLIRQHDTQDDHIGLPTGIRKLDRLLSGLVKGENVVVAADTGAGKTSFALNVTQANCIAGNPVQFFSLEMKRDALFLRLAAGLTGINHLKFRNGGLMSKSELELALQAIAEISKWPLWIDDSGGLTPRELYARGRMQAAKGAQLIVVDYLQKIQAPGTKLYERVTHASECVRVLAKDADVPVLNLSQLSRPEKGAKRRKPTMHDLRESGAIEQDAHSVVLLWRDESENSNGETYYTENDLIIVGKNRSGPTGEIKARYDARTMVWSQDDSDIYDSRAAAAGSE